MRSTRKPHMLMPKSASGLREENSIRSFKQGEAVVNPKAQNPKGLGLIIAYGLGGFRGLRVQCLGFRVGG